MEFKLFGNMFVQNKKIYKIVCIVTYLHKSKCKNHAFQRMKEKLVATQL
jgi:hypothetical protein